MCAVVCVAVLDDRLRWVCHNLTWSLVTGAVGGVGEEAKCCQLTEEMVIKPG